MAVRRVFKQASYAGGCLFFITAVVLAIAWLAGWSARPSSVPTPVPTPSHRPIEVEQVSVIKHANSVDLVAQVRNPNLRAGVARYAITFVLLDPTGQEISQQEVESYLLPGALTYVTTLNVPLDRNLGRVEYILPDSPVFQPLPESISLPSFNSFARERRITNIGSTRIEEQKGIVTNSSTFDWKRVEVTGVALSTNDQIVGVGKTFVGELKVGEQREFTLQWPAPAEPTERVVILPSTNIFQEENIIEIIGDPSSLR